MVREGRDRERYPVALFVDSLRSWDVYFFSEQVVLSFTLRRKFIGLWGT